MLPALSGKRVGDLGCGFGRASRWMRAQGAASLVGLDLSQNMVTRAKAKALDSAIEYWIADLETFELPEAAFDLIYSALTFHDVEDFRRLTRLIHQALVPGGDLVFTIEHPVFMAATRAHWIADEDSRKT
jgi:SAM-dependent methyltransferase